MLNLSVIGDSGPFSRLGKSIGYLLEYDDTRLLVDCGAPIFQILGREGLRTLDGVVATHAHADHQRWFTDLALYRKFNEPDGDRLKLYGSSSVLRDYRWVSSGALEKTLSPDSRSVRSMDFSDYVESIRIGPKPKYHCVLSENNDATDPWQVVNEEGEPLPADRAKVVKPEDSLIPRMLFRDPDEDLWVEPETFYDFSDERFYRQNESDSTNLSEDLTVEPVQSTAWHGPPTTSLLFDCPEGSLFLSSDTVYDPTIWEELTESTPNTPDEDPSFRQRSYITGKIEEYVQQVWSDRRLQEARSRYNEDHVFFHDVSTDGSKVHTTYDNLDDFEGSLILTHSPDEFVTVHPMAHIGKSYVLRDGDLVEKTRRGEEYPMEAACYIKEYSSYRVGFTDPDGDYYLVRKGPGNYQVRNEAPDPAEAVEDVTRIAVYEDIGGAYFPLLEDDNEQYHVRPDDEVVRLVHGPDGSEGTVVSDSREALLSSSNPELTSSLD